MAHGVSHPSQQPLHLRPVAELEAALRRFEEKVRAAQRHSPPTKSFVRNLIERRGAPRPAVYLKRLSLDIMLRHGDGLAELFSEFPDDLVALRPYESSIGYQPAGGPGRVNPVEVLTRAVEWEDEWGTRWRHTVGGVGATPVSYPLEDWRALDDYLAHRMPDARAPRRLDAVLPDVQMHGQAKYCLGIVLLSFFERLQALRGMQNVLEDIYLHPEPVSRLLDVLCEHLLNLVRAWREAGADGLFLADDWGTQSGLMISPAMWRRLFKPYYCRIFQEVHACGMHVIFHSCGNVTEIVEDLIDAGIDVLDPVQPGAMVQAEVARRFGGRVCFSGAIDAQRLAERSPAQVKDDVRRAIDTLSRPLGNALILSPAPVMTPDIPLENICALFEACHGG